MKNTHEKLHPTQILQSDALPPLPDNLLDAQLEIRRLQGQLIQQNHKIAKIVEKRELDKRALVGQIARLRKGLKEIDQGLQDAGVDPYIVGEITARDRIQELL